MKKSEIAAVNEFVVLIGGKNWVRTSCRCTGKWSGILRKAVHQYLRRQKHVASYRLGEYGEGDSGVTIVEFV